MIYSLVIPQLYNWIKKESNLYTPTYVVHIWRIWNREEDNVNMGGGKKEPTKYITCINLRLIYSSISPDHKSEIHFKWLKYQCLMWDITHSLSMSCSDNYFTSKLLRLLKFRVIKTHGTGTEIRYQDPSALPWSKMATATTGKDVYTEILPRQWWLDLV